MRCIPVRTSRTIEKAVLFGFAQLKMIEKIERITMRISYMVTRRWHDT